jgi:hypothetical protein
MFAAGADGGAYQRTYRNYSLRLLQKSALYIHIIGLNINSHIRSIVELIRYMVTISLRFAYEPSTLTPIFVAQNLNTRGIMVWNGMVIDGDRTLC